MKIQLEDLLIPTSFTFSASAVMYNSWLICVSHSPAHKQRKGCHTLQPEAEGEVPAPPAGEAHRPSSTPAKRHLQTETRAAGDEGGKTQEVSRHNSYILVLHDSCFTCFILVIGGYKNICIFNLLLCLWNQFENYDLIKNNISTVLN